jgi:acetylornithine/succinyldiaminopimelate/putrescine aminotransferase
MDSVGYIELENQYGAHNYHPLDVVVHKASGVWLYDVEGKKYLDCLGFICSTSCTPGIKTYTAIGTT